MGMIAKTLCQRRRNFANYTSNKSIIFTVSTDDMHNFGCIHDTTQFVTVDTNDMHGSSDIVTLT